MTRSPLRFVVWLALGFGATTVGANFATDALGIRGLYPRRNSYRAEILWSYNDLATPPDVAVIGSSRVAGGLHSPLIQQALEEATGTDLAVFNLGIAGLRVEWLRQAVEDAFQKRPPRQALVLAVETRFFATPVHADGRKAPRGEWEEEPPTPFAQAFGGLRDLYNLEWLLHESTRTAHALRQAHGGEVHSFAEKKVRDEQNRKRREIAAQRAASGEEGWNIVDSFAMEGLSWNWPGPDSITAVAWRETLDLLAELPCQVIFIRMPLEPGFDEMYMPQAYADFEREIVDEVRARGWPFHDLQGPGWNDDPEWFLSATHLDADGAAHVSRRLATELLAPLLSRE